MIFSSLIIALLAMLMGAILSIPYTFLGGWNKDAFFFNSVFLALVVLIIDWQYHQNVIWNEKWRMPGFLKWKLFALICFTSTPILLNGISKVARYMGYMEFADIIYFFRFAAIPCSILVYLPFFVIRFVSSLILGRKKENSEPEIDP